MWLNARFLVILEASIVVVGTLAVNSGLSVVLDFRASKLFRHRSVYGRRTFMSLGRRERHLARDGCARDEANQERLP